MKSVKANGLWYLADEPSNKVAGTVHYSARGLHLVLLGGFRGGWTPKSEPYPLIYGVVSKTPYGEFVTLIDCFTKRTRMSSAGISSETVYCNRGIIGDAHLPPHHDEFEALNVTLSYLTDWFGRTGFASQIVPGGEFGLDVSYRKPELIRQPIGDEVLVLGIAVKWSESFHTLSIMEEANVVIKQLPRITAERAHVEYVRPLQNLLSFATDTPNEVEEIEFRGESVVRGDVERNRNYHLIYKPIFRLKKKGFLALDDMLFNFHEAQVSGLNIFEKWFEFTRRHASFCTVYFALLYAPPRYVDERFLRLMSAFTLLGTSLGDVPQRTTLFLDDLNSLLATRFSEPERTLLGHIIPTGPEIEMPFQLLKLLEEYRPLMIQIIGDDLSGFVRFVCDATTFIERRVSSGGEPPYEGTGLLDAMQKIDILIKIIILKELGFLEGQISKFVQRNKHFIHMRGL